MNNLVTDIMERFEDLLDKKGIEIPCEDQTEQEERHAENNTAKLYGMEYAALSDEIASLLSGYPCSIFSPMGDVGVVYLLTMLKKSEWNQNSSMSIYLFVW